MKFTEHKLEQVFCELLAQEGYPHSLGNTLPRQPDDVLIESDLHSYLSKCYKNEGITDTEIKSILLELKSLPSSDLYESNKRFMKMLSDGFILKREDRNRKDIYIQLIHYAGLEQQRYDKEDLISIVAEDPAEYKIADKNIYRFVTQLEIHGSEKRIPDGVLYINGLPLVVFEFKSAIREDATIHKFTEDTKLLTDRQNVSCISDEAHCSQTNLDQKIRVSEMGVSKTFGFAKYLHDSLPNAVYVGFTGTPIDTTLDVFGKVVDAYTMTESVRDEIGHDAHTRR